MYVDWRKQTMRGVAGVGGGIKEEGEENGGGVDL